MLQKMMVRVQVVIKGGGKGGGDKPRTEGFGDLDGGSDGEYKFNKISKTSYTYKCYTSNESDIYKLKINFSEKNKNII